MKCPKCNKEMENGFVSCSGFAPGPVINKKIFWYRKKGFLGKEKTNLGNDLEASICEKCKFVFLEY